MSFDLSTEELERVRGFLGREPSTVERVIWSIQGSEHCSYKSSRRFLETLPTTGKHVILGPGEDSGIVAITDSPKGKRWGLVIAHESHNHPSQIVPFEGAATGIGGVVRDVLCMGARVIGCMDMLRLGDLSTEETRTIAKEVTRGIAGYGNPLGLPNLAGDAMFDAAYNESCLVNALAIGLVREDAVIHSRVPQEAGTVGYDIILIGKPTDRSGFGGAAFASASLDEAKGEENTGAVQEPNPFLERHILASTYALFDWLAGEEALKKVSFKDLGAGGIVCATVEQVAERGLGAEIELNAVHVSEENLPPEVIACAETQERLCWMCHPSLTQHILEHYNTVWALPLIANNAGASVIGKVTSDGIYRVRHHGQIVCEADARHITSGLRVHRPTHSLPKTNHPEPSISCNGSVIRIGSFQTTIADTFLALIQHPDFAWKEPIFIHYDKTVIGNTILERGEGDAGVIAPLQDLSSYVHHSPIHPLWKVPAREQWHGIAFAVAGNGRIGRISPYSQGAHAVMESALRVASVGALPRALTDCLNYGNPEIPEQLSALEEGVKGIADAARGIALDGEPLPVVSGNVSLFNGTPLGDPIDPTATVCCIGLLPDARTAVSMQWKNPQSSIYLLGKRSKALGGSAYLRILEECLGCPHDQTLSSSLPETAFVDMRMLIMSLSHCAQEGWIRSSHIIGRGGVVTALLDMTLPQRSLGGTIGAHIDIASITKDCGLSPDTILFGEALGVLIALHPDEEKKTLRFLTRNAVPYWRIGSTIDEPILDIVQGPIPLFHASLPSLHEKYKNGFRKALCRE
ncbi:phosphoribosylformylglycinamidine synthase II [Candidatus Peribacteria bacterium RIFCSPHIGHO2_01_FULL_51_9]|nr:MAG: phosphoribosylformylglycinamidine synthase II [Candidatus Peribacteria bacterium RIFCSPHIGHO2_01_FULL_51_9]